MKKSSSRQRIIMIAALAAPLALVFPDSRAELPTGIGSASDPIRGVLRPLDEAVLSTDLVARVKRVRFKEGQRFKAGDLLIKFDCGRVNAEIAAAWATHRARKQTLKTNKRLAQYKAIGIDELSVSQAEADQAAAMGRAAQTRNQDCEIVAPFNGRVVETMIHDHETNNPGSPLMKIVDDTSLEVEMILPSRWLTRLKQGHSFKFSVDETGKRYAARLVRFGGAVDAASQTIKAVGLLEDTDPVLLPGMSGSAQFEANDG